MNYEFGHLPFGFSGTTYPSIYTVQDPSNYYDLSPIELSRKWQQYTPPTPYQPPNVGVVPVPQQGGTPIQPGGAGGPVELSKISSIYNRLLVQYNKSDEPDQIMIEPYLQKLQDLYNNNYKPNGQMILEECEQFLNQLEAKRKPLKPNIPTPSYDKEKLLDTRDLLDNIEREELSEDDKRRYDEYVKIISDIDQGIYQGNSREQIITIGAWAVQTYDKQRNAPPPPPPTPPPPPPPTQKDYNKDKFKQLKDLFYGIDKNKLSIENMHKYQSYYEIISQIDQEEYFNDDINEQINTIYEWASSIKKLSGNKGGGSSGSRGNKYI